MQITGPTTTIALKDQMVITKMTDLKEADFDEEMRYFEIIELSL